MHAVLTGLLQDALHMQVSDIHFSLRSDGMTIQMRCLGTFVPYDKPIDTRMVAYLRYICHMDLSAGALPQTGQTTVRLEDKDIPLRFAYIMTATIETGVLRLLHQSVCLPLDALSYEAAPLKRLRQVMSRNHGLVLLSGPTGCGKTTTLYALLDVAVSLGRQVITLEDPIEIIRPNIIQLQVNHFMHMGYEEGIRQVLRHDPDIIMLGEIRDSVTALAVVRCALSGHLVLSTVHAKDCLGVITRMIEFGVTSLDLRQTLILSCTQRLVKRKNKKERTGIYAIWDEAAIQAWFQNATYTDSLQETFRRAVEADVVSRMEAQKEGFACRRL